MKRYLGWTLLVAAGLLLGVASSSYQRSNADSPPPTADSGDVNADTVAVLKEIRAQLKEINAHLNTGVTKVTVVMNANR
jgi:enamine deaminase RidA (YjgF/YER057c/UK114 family)